MTDPKNQTNGQRLGLAMGSLSVLANSIPTLPEWLKIVPIVGIIAIVMYFMFLEAKLKFRKK